MQDPLLAGADASRRQRRGRGAKPAGQDRKGGRGGARRQAPPAWVGRAPAASEPPHPGHGGMRPAAGARSPTQRAGQEIGLLCTAHRLPAPSRAAAWSLLLLRLSLIGHPDFPVSCGRETGPNGAGMLAFRNAPEAAAEPKPKLFPVFSRPSGKTAPQGRRRVRRRLRPQPAVSPCFDWFFAFTTPAPKRPETRAFVAAVKTCAPSETPRVPERPPNGGARLTRPFRQSEFSRPGPGPRRARMECGPRRNRFSRASFAAGRPKGRMAKRAGAL